MKSELATAILLESIVQGGFASPNVTELRKLQWSIMRGIQHMPADRCDAQKIARYLGAPYASVSRELRKMQLQGLVRAERSGRDQRVKLFTLTSSGISTLKCDPMVTIAHAIGEFPQGEREKLEQLVRELVLLLFDELGSNGEIALIGEGRA